MKKQIVTACALIASVAAFATSVESENIFGVLKLPDTNTVELIIGVPWVKVGSGNVSPTNLVLATNLRDNDMLYMYDQTASAYKAWTVSSGVWTDTSTYTIGSGNYDSLSKNGAEALARGEALILKRTGDVPYPVVYLSGQYTGTSAGRVQIKYPTTDDVPMQVYYTLIANPLTTDVNLESCLFYTTVDGSDVVTDFNNGWTGDHEIWDRIQLSDGTVYGRDSTGWYKFAQTSTTVYVPGHGDITTTENTKVRTDLTILAGQGAWYVRAGRSPIYMAWPE